MGPEKVDALREDGAARGSDVSKRLCSIDTKAMDPSERPARRNLQKKKCNSQSAHLINLKGSVSRKKYVGTFFFWLAVMKKVIIEIKLIAVTFA